MLDGFNNSWTAMVLYDLSTYEVNKSVIVIWMGNW